MKVEVLFYIPNHRKMIIKKISRYFSKEKKIPAPVHAFSFRFTTLQNAAVLEGAYYMHEKPIRPKSEKSPKVFKTDFRCRFCGKDHENKQVRNL